VTLSSSIDIESAIATWVDLFNNDPHRMVDECYADDATISIPGFFEFYSSRALHQAETATLKAFPNRRVTVVRTHIYGEFAVVEGVYYYGTGIRDTHFCTLLRFRDGLIISDRTYMTAHTPQVVAADGA